MPPHGHGPEEEEVISEYLGVLSSGKSFMRAPVAVQSQTLTAHLLLT
jgi:hypothetical protein